MTDLMRVEQILAPLEAASLEGPSPAEECEHTQGQSHHYDVYDDLPPETPPGGEEGAAGTASDDDEEGVAPMMSPSQPTESQRAVEASRLEDYTFYDMDSGHEVRCGSLFGGERSGSDNCEDPRIMAASEGSRNPKNWKLDINMRIGRDDNASAGGEIARGGGGADGSGALGDYIHVVSSYISSVLHIPHLCSHQPCIYSMFRDINIYHFCWCRSVDKQRPSSALLRYSTVTVVMV